MAKQKSLVDLDGKALVIFMLAVALLAALFGWKIGAAFAAGWMIRNYMWVRNINKNLPEIVKRETLKALATAMEKARKSGGMHLN